jgi:hypothetical protein
LVGDSTIMRGLDMEWFRISGLNYGRGFGVLEAIVSLSGLPVSYIEPAKWSKVMHAVI